MLTDAKPNVLDEVNATSALPSLNELLPADAGEATVRELIRTAKRVLETLRGGERVHPGVEAQARAVVDELNAALKERGDKPSLRLAEDGTWFETGAGRVDVARRGAVRRILSALANHRSESGRPLKVDELFEIGWPGERIPYESQVRRVYTAVWTLRTLGLESVLLTRDEGYLLDPKQAFEIVA
jgi:hypothetical protein